MAVSSETVVIAGPLTLLQSGDPVVNQALIARYPINIAGHRYANSGYVSMRQHTSAYVTYADVC